MIEQQQAHTKIQRSGTVGQWDSRTVGVLWPWLAFVGLLAFGWRVSDPLRNISAYGDALEVIWGIEWYHATLIERGVSPLFAPQVFSPNGWHTATLAHTPLLFLVGALLRTITGSVALAYNLLGCSSLVIAFSGARRFFRYYSAEWAAVCAALVFTFASLRWERIGGHLHMLWATSLLPWFLLSLVAVVDLPVTAPRRQWIKRILWSGLCWGVLINVSLYAIFLGAVALVIGGKGWWRPRHFAALLAIGGLALLCAAPLIALYLQAVRLEQPVQQSILYLLLGWSASLDSLFLPSLNHPLPLVAQWARTIYGGPINESGLMNLGTITWLLALIGLVASARWRAGQARGLLWLAGAGLLLALGVLLRWHGSFVQIPALAPLNRWLWQWGHALKPVLFDQAAPDFFFGDGVPLPAYWLAVILPYWESARVLARYAWLGGLGVLGLAAIGLGRVPVRARWLLIGLWLLESLPAFTGNRPLPTVPHPAHAWLAQQTLAAGEGIIDLTADPARMVSGEIVYATLFHGKATVSGVGSFAPRQLFYLQKWFFDDPAALARPQTAQLLLGYGVRFTLFHVLSAEDWPTWEKLKSNPAVRVIGCFDPLEAVSPWPYPICISELLPPPLWPQINAQLGDGWSGVEPWGVWAEGQRSQAQWVATQQRDYQLAITAFPYCPADQTQSLTVLINGQPVGEQRWQNCDEWQGAVTIPARVVQVGWNDLELRFGYAVQPAGDARQLAVGFSELRFR